MIRRAGSLVLGALVLAGSCASPDRSPTVDGIVARYVEARGGLERIRGLQSLRQTGTLSTGAGRTAVAVRELRRPSFTRFEFTVQGVTGVYVSDGQQGWQVSPFDGDLAPVALPDEVVAEAAEQGDLEGPLVDWKAKGHRVELAGTEPVDGREAYTLTLTLRSGAVRQEYVDAATWLLVRTDTTRQVRGRPVRIRTTYHDYAVTDGLAFPRRIEVEAVGRPRRLRILVDRVEVNPPLDGARFAPPSGGAP